MIYIRAYNCHLAVLHKTFFRKFGHFHGGIEVLLVEKMDNSRPSGLLKM